MGSCYFCGTEIPPDEKIYRSSECPQCRRPLKICKNCRFFSPGSHHDCKETISDPVTDKEASNFCDYFSFSGGGSKSGMADAEAQEARKKFDSLFG